MKQYFYQFGANPEIKAHMSMSGPQGEDQIPEEIKKLLDKEGVTHVIVLTKQEDMKGISCYQKIEE